ncbi:B box-type domain-containing protein [Aphis craccivora]|uniref:B box-type domain-containing protein n=1 Tax=Aphis craccivora TaxID=307492 RepID=A0A6G0W1T6_APHCR|nr:B box-type domain-containing protein [Aphis craccivora]
MPKPLKILKTDNQKLSNSIINHNWSEILEFTDVNKATQYFISTLNNLKNQASAEISISSKTKKLKPWATTAIINSIRRRDRLHLQVKKHPLNLNLKDYYVKFRNTITKIIKNAKILYYKAEFIKSGNNTKLKWQNINNILAKNKKSNNLKELLNNCKYKNEYTNENLEYILAEKFNKYFINVATDLVTSLKNTTNFDNNSQNKVYFNKFDLITHTEIFEAISKLKNGSSPGLDKISADLLKNIV